MRTRFFLFFIGNTIRPEGLRRMGTWRGTVRHAGRYYAVPVFKPPANRGQSDRQKVQQAQETNNPRSIEAHLVSCTKY